MDDLYHAAFLALNASDAPSPLVVSFAIVCAKYLYFLVPLQIALAWFAGARNTRFIALSGVVAIAIALVASGLTGLVWPTPRPFVLGLGHTLVDHRASPAFPSNHAIVCFAWAGTLALYGRAWLAYAVALTGLLVAWSRIYLGVHYPFDMIGAAAFSGLAALAAGWLMTRAGGPLLGFAEGATRRILAILPRGIRAVRLRATLPRSADRAPQRALRGEPLR